MKEIKTWKEFYGILNPKFHGSFNQKVYRRLFSYAVRNAFTVYSDEKNYEFKRVKGNFETICRGSHLTDSSRYTKVPTGFKATLLRCISTGYEVQMPWKGGIEAIKDSKGNYKVGNFTHFNSIINSGLEDVAWSGRKDDLERDFYYDKNYIVEVEYKHARSYALKLVVKDFLWYKKGQLIDFYYQHKKFNYHDRNPLDLFYGSYAHSVYNVGNDSLACDLNKVTLEQLKAINVSPYSCSKQQFGCQRGCTSYCYADSSNRADAARKAFLIKVYTDLGLGK